MYKNKRVLAVVPARGGSKGVKLKNLKKINNISLIGHVSNVLNNLPIIDNKIVSTDHKDIIKESLKYNIDVPFIRPNKISRDKTIIIIAHCLSSIQKCDCIYFMKNGSIVDLGAFEELMSKNLDFKRMVEISKI